MVKTRKNMVKKKEKKILTRKYRKDNEHIKTNET